MNTTRTVRAALIGIVIGTGLLMTGCSSTSSDPTTQACTLLADARNNFATAVYQNSIDPSISNSDAVTETIIELSTQSREARDAAPADLRAVFAVPSDSLAGVVDVLASDSSSAIIQQAFQPAGAAIGRTLRVCVTSGVPVQVVDQATGQTSQMS